MEKQVQGDAKAAADSTPSVDVSPVYSLPELIDLAERQNPATRQAWAQARDRGAALGIARSELYPTLVATALAGINRGDVLFGTLFYTQTIENLEGELELNYLIFDFGGRAGRISAAKAQLLAANFAFNDTHRQVIYQVEQAYYQVLNEAGQLDAARVSLTNAVAVRQAAEDRLHNGLATLPDVLEAQSAEAQAQYELEAALGATEVARANLAYALGISPTLPLQSQPLDKLIIPENTQESVDKALDRAFAQRPDLLQHLAEVRAANARVKEARAAYYPQLNIFGAGAAESLGGTQQSLPWVHTKDWAGGAGLSLTWSVFDGGLRRNRLAQAKDDVLSSQAKVEATRDSIAREVWSAYSDLRTAFRERQSATALLAAADQSYAAALDSYNHGVRNLLDVTAAQRTLAQARSTDVFARTAVLSSLANLVFRTGDSIQPGANRSKP